MAAEKVRRRELAAKLRNIHWHDIGFTFGVDKRHLFMRFCVIDIVNTGDDDAFIFHQVDCRILAWGRAGTGAGLLLPGCFQLLQHANNARFLIRFENIVKRFQFECFYRMLFPGGNEHDKRFMGELTDILRQKDSVQGRDVDIKENGVHFVVL